jgi:hypothetical protein
MMSNELRTFVKGDDGLCTFYNVEVGTTGTWSAMTGEITFTEEDFASAVDAVNDPAIKSPKLKIGHLDPRFTPDDVNGSIFDGNPALGKIINLRLGNNNQSVYGDIVGVPEWLAKIMPTAFPSRSLEGWHQIKTATGKVHDFVITAVSLLGVEAPAVETIEDLQVLFSSDGPEGVEIIGDRVAAVRGERMSQKVAASLSVEDIRRSFYDDFATEESGRYWWWIRGVYVEPSLVIVDGDDDTLYAVAYTPGDNDVTVWGDPVEVFTQFVEKDSGKVAASKRLGVDALLAGASDVYNNAEDSRLENRPKEVKAMGIDIPALRDRLSLTAEQLPDDASEESINALLANPPVAEPPEGGAPEEIVEDVAEEDAALVAAANGVTIDKAAYEQLQASAAMGVEARKEQLKADRTAIVTAAQKKGKFPPAAAAGYLAQLSRGGEIEKQTREFIEQLPENTVPVEETGGAGEPDVAAAQGYDESWLSPAEQARVAAAREGRPVNNRIIVEA